MDIEIPVILGRPFVDISMASVNVKYEEPKFRVNNEDVTFNMYKSMIQPKKYQVVSFTDVVDEAVASVEEVFSIGESLAVVLYNIIIGKL